MTTDQMIGLAAGAVVVLALYLWALTFDKLRVARAERDEARKLAKARRATLEAVAELSPEYREVFPDEGILQRYSGGVNWDKVEAHAQLARQHRERAEGLDAYARTNGKLADARREWSR